MGEEKKPNTDDLEKGAGQKVDMKKEILSWVFYIAFVLVLTWVIITFVGQRTRVDGRSMMNTLHDGDNLIVEKLSYRFSDPKRFDIIVFPPTGKKEYYIKRIIGLPGETVSIKDGFVYINGEKLDEDYLPVSGITQSEKTTFEVPAGHIFAMGDNRTGSLDSRYWNDPYIPLNQLQGRMLLAISIGPKQSWQGIHWIA